MTKARQPLSFKEQSELTKIIAKNARVVEDTSGKKTLVIDTLGNAEARKALGDLIGPRNVKLTGSFDLCHMLGDMALRKKLLEVYLSKTLTKG